MTTNVEFRKLIDRVRRNPAAIQAEVIDLLERDTNGEVRIVDPTNPVVFTLESAIALSVGNLESNEVLNHRQYPSSARSYDDLYRHMADIDYLNRFATPSRTTLSFLFDANEIKTKAVAVPGDTGISKITIPRHTEVSVGGIAFTMQYPIDIEVMPHGGISVTYDTSVHTPLQTLHTNLLDYSINKIDNIDVLRIDVPIHQMKISSTLHQVNGITGFMKNISFTDSFYYCRAYVKKNNVWNEIKITHSDQVYDANVPTVVLKVLNQSLNVTIPQIYFNTDKITDAIRLDIYTTKGPMDIDLASYEAEAYVVKWNDLDNRNKNIYSAPINSFNVQAIMSTYRVTGGSGYTSFAELRERVIMRSQTTEGLPISSNQLVTNIKDSGFDVVTNVDNITDRQFLATRDLPEPSNKTTVNAAGTAIMTLGIKTQDIETHLAVRDNENRLTITPEMLYTVSDKVLKPVEYNKVALMKDINTTTVEQLATEVNSSDYLFSPFHYVLDVDTDYFNARPYYLTSPKVVSKFFVQENGTALIDVRSTKQSIEYSKDHSGYTLLVTLKGTEVFNALDLEQIHLQLSYKARDANVRQWINGKLVSPIDPNTSKPVEGEYIYKFEIETKFDIDKFHGLHLSPSTTAVDLSHDFDLLVIVSNHMPTNAVVSDIDKITNPKVLVGYDDTTSYLGIVQETIGIKFGSYLENLWCRSRSAAASHEYERYTEDTYGVYKEDVYARDANGNIKMTYDTNSNILKLIKKHNKGDPIVDSKGNRVVQYPKGSIKYDDNGKPITKYGRRGINRFIDIYLMDGKYYFATDPSTIFHKQEVERIVVDWITHDLSLISNRLIERSRIYFYPRSTVGEIKGEVEEGITVYVDAVQKLNVVYHVDKRTFDSPQLREAISDSTVRVLKQVFRRSTISKSDIINTLKHTVGEDVKSIVVKGFLRDEYPAITISDKSAIPALGKRLLAQSNLTTRVVDDIEIDFIEL